MKIILLLIYTLASGETNSVSMRVYSMAECYARGSEIVVASPPGKVTYKCMVSRAEEEEA